MFVVCRVFTVAASTQNRYFSNAVNATRFTGATWYALLAAAVLS
jgi:hypothetical protein